MDWKLELVVAPVSDVDRGSAFFGEHVGFVADLDDQFGDDGRVVQLTPPGSACPISLGSGLVDSEPGSLQGMQLVVSNIVAARTRPVDRGMEVGEIDHFEDGARGNDPSAVPIPSRRLRRNQSRSPDGYCQYMSEVPHVSPGMGQASQTPHTP